MQISGFIHPTRISVIDRQQLYFQLIFAWYHIILVVQKFRNLSHVNDSCLASKNVDLLSDIDFSWRNIVNSNKLHDVHRTIHLVDIWSAVFIMTIMLNEYIEYYNDASYFKLIQTVTLENQMINRSHVT